MWLLQGLQDGQPPAAWAWVVEPTHSWMDDGYQPQPGDVLSDVNPEGKVWDQSRQELRERTPAEQTAWDTSVLAALKAKRKKQLAFAADAQAKDEIPTFVALVVAAKFVPPNNTTYLTPAELVVFNRIQAGYSKLSNLYAQVDAATTIEQIQAIVW